jgi:hypothetical protein
MSTLNTYNLKSPDSANTNLALDASGNVAIQAGSASAPSIYVTGDTNTGLYSPGADQIAVTTGGTARLFIDSSGRLLVGTTTSNGAQLEVNRPQSVATGLSALLSSPQFSITNSSNWGFPVGAVFKTPLANGGAIVDNAAIWAEWSDTNSAYLGFATRNSGTIAERVRIDSSGRLLVGTSSARANFYNSTGTAQLQVEGITQSSSSISVTYNDNGVGGPVVTLNKSRSASVGGNTIVSSGDALGNIYFQGNDGTEFVEAALIRAEVDGTPGSNDMPGRLVFSTTADGASSPTERMRISNNGTIFLNATSLTDGANIQGANAYVGWRFDVGSNSDTLADQNTALCSSVYTSTNTGRATSALLLMSRAGESVGICPLIKGYGGAGASPSTATLQFLVSHNGNVQNTNNSYGSLSDLRLKENIVDAESQWQDIKSLQVRKFNFKNDAAKTPLLGLVAQEVEPISPGLIEQVLQADGTPDPEIPKAIKYSVLYMKAVKALQEAMERIETLEAKVAALESA